MAHNAPNEVEEIIKHLKTRPGFHAYILMNNDGIIIKYENMEYRQAVMHAYHILELCNKSKQYINQLIESPENDIESMRLRTKQYEMIIAQYSKFTIILLQVPMKERKPDNTLNNANNLIPGNGNNNNKLNEDNIKDKDIEEKINV